MNGGSGFAAESELTGDVEDRGDGAVCKGKGCVF